MTVEMACKLDWFSFTFHVGLQGAGDNEYRLRHVLDCLGWATAERFADVNTGILWEWREGHGFYSSRVVHPVSLMSISWHENNPWALCELSGRAVDRVLQSISHSDLARAANGRATRLDFAVDIETDFKPEEFCDERGKSAITSGGEYHTETGSTCYVGSRKSDRMARVYRYAPPHPRSHLLRIESEQKGSAAKVACDALITKDLTEVCLATHLPFAWQHPVWSPSLANVSKLPARYYDHEGAGTLKWLNDTVAPALKKAHENGLIELKKWLSDHFPNIPL